METAGLSQQTDKRRKRITRLVAGALAAALFAVAWAYWSRRARKEVASPSPQTLPSNVERQLSGYTYTRSEGGRRIFTVHAARTLDFKKEDSTVLEDVYVEVFGATGTRHDVLRTERCDYNPKSGELFAAGKVNIQLNDLAVALPNPRLQVGRSAPNGPEKVFLETSKVYLKEQGTLLDTDEPVKFRSESASGTARGMTYNTRTGSFELTSEVVLNLPARAGRQPIPETSLVASRLSLDKEKNEVRIWGPVEIRQAGRTVKAGRGTIELQGTHRVSQAHLEEGVHGIDKTPGHLMDIRAQGVQANFDPVSGALRTLLGEGNVKGEVRRSGKVSRIAAQQVSLAFSGVHPQPENGAASGGVILSVESLPGAISNAAPSVTKDSLGAARQELTAAQVRFAFRPKQQTLEGVQTVGMGHLVLVPTNTQMGTREVFADPLVMEFDARSRLEVLRGLSRSRMVLQPSKNASSGTPADESTSDRLKASFDPATNTLKSVEQSGNFEFAEGERKSSAEQAVYESRNQVLTLTGHPQVWDPDIRVHADRIVMNLQTNDAEGLGHVQSTQVKIGSQAPGTGKDLPTNVVAERVLEHRASQFVHYEGHVHAWHGQDVVESPSLDIYKRERKIVSTSGVLSSFIQARPVDSKIGASRASAEARPVTIRADRLEYSDVGREAVYQGKVELRTGTSTLRADRLEVYFVAKSTAESSELERAVADGHVTIAQPGRHATGEHADYFEAQGKILLSGGPPAVYDAQGFTTGRSLTLNLHDDTIFVDGGDKSPTLSKHRISP